MDLPHDSLANVIRELQQVPDRVLNQEALVMAMLEKYVPNEEQRELLRFEIIAYGNMRVVSGFHTGHVNATNKPFLIDKYVPVAHQEGK